MATDEHETDYLTLDAPEPQNFSGETNLEETRATGFEHGGIKCNESSMLNTIDRFHEAQHFYEQILDTYHNPWNIRYSINAFLQAFRGLTHMIRRESKEQREMKKWYSDRFEMLMEKPLWKALIDARNNVVHEGSLKAESSVYIGLFKYYTPKLCVKRTISPFMATEDILQYAKDFDKHYEPGVYIGEQLGVARCWVVPEIGHGEVAHYCRVALAFVNRLIDEMYHRFFDSCFPPHYLASPWPSRVYLETDAHPDLGIKWGWAPPPIGPLRRQAQHPDEMALIRREQNDFLEKVARDGLDNGLLTRDLDDSAFQPESDVDIPTDILNHDQ